MKNTAITFDEAFGNLEATERITIGAVSVDRKYEFYAGVNPLPEGYSDFVHKHIVP